MISVLPLALLISLSGSFGSLDAMLAVPQESQAPMVNCQAYVDNSTSPPTYGIIVDGVPVPYGTQEEVMDAWKKLKCNQPQ